MRQGFQIVLKSFRPVGVLWMSAAEIVAHWFSSAQEIGPDSDHRMLDAAKKVSISMPTSLYEAGEVRRASLRYKSFSSYVQHLIEMDVDTGGSHVRVPLTEGQIQYGRPPARSAHQLNEPSAAPSPVKPLKSPKSPKS